ncbi:hypothetical protein WA158_000431 [Blastocystis sp. Blastoise]
MEADKAIGQFKREMKQIGWADLRPWEDFFGKMSMPKKDLEKIEKRFETNVLFYRTNYIYLCSGLLLIQCLFNIRFLLTVAVVAGLIIYLFFEPFGPIIVNKRRLNDLEKIAVTIIGLFICSIICGTLLQSLYSLLAILGGVTVHSVFRERSIKAKLNYESTNIKLTFFRASSKADSDDQEQGELSSSTGLVSSPRTEEEGLRRREEYKQTADQIRQKYNIRSKMSKTIDDSSSDDERAYDSFLNDFSKYLKNIDKENEAIDTILNDISECFKNTDRENEALSLKQQIYDLLHDFSDSLNQNDHKNRTLKRKIEQKLDDLIEEDEKFKEYTGKVEDKNKKMKFIFQGSESEMIIDTSILRNYKDSHLYEFYIDLSKRNKENSGYIDFPYSNIDLLKRYLYKESIDYALLSSEELIQFFNVLCFLNIGIRPELSRMYMSKSPYNLQDAWINRKQLLINGKVNTEINNYLILNHLQNILLDCIPFNRIQYNKESNYFEYNLELVYEDIIQGIIKKDTHIVNKIYCTHVDSQLLMKELYMFGILPTGQLSTVIMMSQTLVGSAIMLQIHDAYLNSFMKDYMKNKNYYWKLLFRASENAFSCERFHEYCDNKTNLLVLVSYKDKNDLTYRFGGFTSKGWTKPKKYQPNTWIYARDKNAFLFSFNNPHNTSPIKLKATDKRDTLSYCSQWGPCFNGGISICQFCHKVNSSCYFTTNTTDPAFCIDPIYGFSLFTNTAANDKCNEFKIEEYEVFQCK